MFIWKNKCATIVKEIIKRKNCYLKRAEAKCQYLCNLGSENITCIIIIVCIIIIYET